ncbi:MAG: hypothetical protein SGBAC_011710, partial [Bacillariaceae sp.]
GDWNSPLQRSVVTKSNRSAASGFNDDESSEVIMLPNWIQSYKIWHKRQRRRYDREGATDVNFLVVACLKRAKCGGLSDRVRSIPYWLVLAEKTDRVLLIHWTKKYKLEDFWIPPSTNEALDWRLLDEWTTQLPFLDSCIHKPAKVMPEFHDESNHQDIMNALRSTAPSERVVCVKTRSDLTPLVYDSFHATAATNTTEIVHQQMLVVSKVYDFMFTPTEPLQDYINQIKKEQIGLNPNEPYLAAHIRALYPLKAESGNLVWPSWQEHSEIIKRWAETAVERVIDAYNNSSDHGTNHNNIVASQMPPIYVYVASDCADVVEYILSISDDASRWPTNARVVGLQKSLPRHHLDLDTANNSAYDMFPLFFDISMLSHAKCLSFGIGSYGRFGARLSGLSCITQHRKSQYLDDNL